MAKQVSPSREASFQVRFEPGFIQSQGWLVAPPVVPNQRLVDYLAHCVSKHPQDLRAHVQRIMLCLRLQLPELLYGAVLDLFIALGDKGYPIRQRLLEQSASCLTEHHQAFLHARLLSGIGGRDVVPPSRFSRLTEGVTGRLDFIGLTSEPPLSLSAGVMAQARDLLDSGMITDARELLESALLESPADLQISQELLIIYRHTRDAVSLAAMMRRLEGLPLAARAEWEALDAELTGRGGA